MTTHPPKTLAECTGLVNEAIEALMASNLSSEQKQHIGALANAYLYATRTATSLGESIKELDKMISRVEQHPNNTLN
jgi:hypothetical protein